MAMTKMEPDKAEAGKSASVTLGQYLFDCLKAEGITEIFGIPGDYNFSLLDTLERYEGIEFVGGRNELGAGYAADGYARIKGMSALITTFGVGEMSAVNTVAGASSERIPLVHIVGSPKSKDQAVHKRMHHTLMDGDYDVFRKMYAHLCAYTAVLTPENAELEIPAALAIAKRERKPVYLVVAIDLVTKPIVLRNAVTSGGVTGERVAPQPVPQAAPQTTSLSIATNPAALQAALQRIQELLAASGDRTVMLSDMLCARFGLKDAAKRLAEGLNLPTAVLPLGKGSFDERHPNYIGVYAGAFGSGEVRDIVERSAAVLSVGLLLSDTNTANDTAKLNRAVLVDIQPDMVRIGEAAYQGVMATDLIDALLRSGWKRNGAIPVTAFPYDAMIGEPDGLLAAASYYPRLQAMLKAGDIVVAETGTLSYGLSQVRLPAGADYIGQQAWQSIGYATPAAFGAAVAAPGRRVLLFTGDGSLQLTVQEISTMLERGCRPIIFVLNNNGYTIEKYLNVKTSNQRYNDIPAWRYTQLAEAFGGQAFSAQARTNRELDEAIAAAEREQASKLCIVELIVSDPMDAPEYLKTLRRHMEQQERMGQG